jgi:hypothetical protein
MLLRALKPLPPKGRNPTNGRPARSFRRDAVLTNDRKGFDEIPNYYSFEVELLRAGVERVWKRGQ